MHFHCPPKFIERPELLIDGLTAHEVVIKFDTSTLQGIGAIDLEPLADCDRYEAFRIALRTQAVKDEAFEKAAKFADQRDALLDQLNKSCTT